MIFGNVVAQDQDAGEILSMGCILNMPARTGYICPIGSEKKLTDFASKIVNDVIPNLLGI